MLFVDREWNLGNGTLSTLVCCVKLFHFVFVWTVWPHSTSFVALSQFCPACSLFQCHVFLLCYLVTEFIYTLMDVLKLFYLFSECKVIWHVCKLIVWEGCWRVRLLSVDILLHYLLCVKVYVCRYLSQCYLLTYIQAHRCCVGVSKLYSAVIRPLWVLPNLTVLKDFIDSGVSCMAVINTYCRRQRCPLVY